MPLQRAMVDFGSDESFLDATKKVREHYGVEVPLNAARQHTLGHARAIGALEHKPAAPAKVVITGMDGSMIPIVESGTSEDQRKDKTLSWKQANLCCARSQEAVECIYGATLASVKMASLIWRTVAVGAGLVSTSHAVADGADAIFNAFTEQFALEEGKAKFTVDFYHVDEHLGEAAESIAPARKKEWLHEQKGRLLENKVGEVLKTLWKPILSLWNKRNPRCEEPTSTSTKEKTTWIMPELERRDFPSVRVKSRVRTGT